MHPASRASLSLAHLVVDAKKYSSGYDDDRARPFAVLTSAKMCSVGMSLSPSDGLSGDRPREFHERGSADMMSAPNVQRYSIHL